jgi:hypothetical protein
MSPFLIATKPHLKPKLLNYTKKSINHRDHCPPVSFKADTEITDSTKPAPRRNPARSYAAVATFGSTHIASPSKESADRESTLDAASAVPSPKVSTVKLDSDGFKTVSLKREREREREREEEEEEKKTAPGASTVNTVKHCRQPLIGICNSPLLPIISKQARSKTLFVSRFCPGVSADDTEKSLEEQLSLKKLVCTRLKTKFNTYASFHVSVIEDDFPLLNNTAFWPTGCLIAPFYGKLTPDQVYSSSTPVSGERAPPVASDSVKPKGDDGAHGGSS